MLADRVLLVAFLGLRARAAESGPGRLVLVRQLREQPAGGVPSTTRWSEISRRMCSCSATRNRQARIREDSADVKGAVAILLTNCAMSPPASDTRRRPGWTGPPLLSQTDPSSSLSQSEVHRIGCRTARLRNACSSAFSSTGPWRRKASGTLYVDPRGSICGAAHTRCCSRVSGDHNKSLACSFIFGDDLIRRQARAGNYPSHTRTRGAGTHSGGAFSVLLLLRQRQSNPPE